MRLLFADGLFWTSVACCLVAQSYIIRSVRGARYVPAATAGLPRHHRTLELVWAVAPAIGLVILLACTWRAIHTVDSVPGTRSRMMPAPARTTA